jgi:hypothetical protein
MHITKKLISAVGLCQHIHSLYKNWQFQCLARRGMNKECAVSYRSRTDSDYAYIYGAKDSTQGTVSTVSAACTTFFTNNIAYRLISIWQEPTQHAAPPAMATCADETWSELREPMTMTRRASHVPTDGVDRDMLSSRSNGEQWWPCPAPAGP